MEIVRKEANYGEGIRHAKKCGMLGVERGDERKATAPSKLRCIDRVQDGPCGYSSPANFLERETMCRRR